MKRSSTVPEVFLPIRHYEGHYEISNLGRVRSLTRVVRHGGARGGRYTSAGRLLAVHPNSCGYLRVNLCVEDVRQKHLIHRLVARHFLHNEHKHPCVNHMDSNKENNEATNLEWCTYSENMLHRNRAQQ